MLSRLIRKLSLRPRDKLLIGNTSEVDELTLGEELSSAEIEQHYRSYQFRGSLWLHQTVGLSKT